MDLTHAFIARKPNTNTLYILQDDCNLMMVQMESVTILEGGLGVYLKHVATYNQIDAGEIWKKLMPNLENAILDPYEEYVLSRTEGNTDIGYAFYPAICGMDTHQYIALERKVKELFADHQKKILFDKNIEEAERQHWEECMDNDWIEWKENPAFGFSI